MKILLIEDEDPAAKRLQKMLKEIGQYCKYSLSRKMV
jgi:DNA-binding response OmpR family regulator